MRVAMVTGGAGGLAQGMTHGLLRMGYKVCLLDRSEEAGTAVAQKLAAAHGDDAVMFILCDVSKSHEFEAAWDTCEERLGAPNLLVNNAAVCDEMEPQKMVDVNVTGAILGTTLAQSRMRRSGGGAVLNIASSTGLSGLYLTPVYSATKHAVVGLTTSFGHPALYAESKVKMLCLCPGAFLSPLLKSTRRNPDTLNLKFGVNPLTIQDVAAGALKLLQEGANGAVMVLEKGKEPWYHTQPSVDHGFFAKEAPQE